MAMEFCNSHVWGAVMNAGWSRSPGFCMWTGAGKPSLVLDLVEEFRQPVVDRAIFSWLNKGGQLTLVKGMLDGESRENVAARVLLRLNATEQHRGSSIRSARLCRCRRGWRQARCAGVRDIGRFL